MLAPKGHPTWSSHMVNGVQSWYKHLCMLLEEKTFEEATSLIIRSV